MNALLTPSAPDYMQGNSPPFFKQRMPIDDIVADVTAFDNLSHRITTIVYYDSIYNAKTSFTFPTCALSDFNSSVFKPKGKQLRGLDLDKKPALGKAVDVREECIKNICAAVVLVRDEENEDDFLGGTTLSHHVPQYVQKVIDRAVNKDSAAITIQSIARKWIDYCNFKPKMMQLKKEKVAAIKIQGRARGNKARADLKQPRLRHAAARRIQSKIRSILSRMLVADLKEQIYAAVRLQSLARQRRAEGVAEVERIRKREATEWSASIALQGQMRMALSRRELGHRKRQKKSAVLIQSLERRRKAERVVKAKRTQKREATEWSASTVLQGQMRMALSRRELQHRKLQKKSAIALQSKARQNLARRNLHHRRRERYAAVTIQSKARQKVARKKVVLRKQFVRNLEENSTVVLQKRARVLIARKKVRGMKKEVSASTLLQAQMRMALSRRELFCRKERRDASITIQCKFRCIQAFKYASEIRKIRDNILSMQLKIRKHEASIVLQKFARCIKAKRIVNQTRRKKLQAILIQKRIRMVNAKMKLNGKKEEVASMLLRRNASAVVLQCAFRLAKAAKLRNAMAGEHMSAIVLQCSWRMTKAKLETQQLAKVSLEIAKAKKIQALWRMGASKAAVAKKRGAMAALQRALEERREACSVLIQAKIRASLARRHVKIVRMRITAAVKIQKLARVILMKRAVKKIRIEKLMAVRIQTFLRSKVEKSKFIQLLELHNAALFIQCQARVLFSKNKLKEKRLRMDGVKWDRMILIQKRVRMCIARWHVEELRERRRAGGVLQRAVRVYQARERLKDLRFLWSIYVSKVVKVQSLWRRRTAMLWLKQWMEWWKWENANAVLIQARWRGVFARKTVKEWKEYWHKFDMACKIQARVRGAKARKDYYFGTESRRPKSPIFFSWVRHGRVDNLKELLDWKPTFGQLEDKPSFNGVEFHPDIVSHGNNTLLMTAACAGNRRIVKELVAAGASIDAVDDNGNTAAHFCFLSGHHDLGYYIVDSLGADDTIENNDGADCYAMTDVQLENKRPSMFIEGALGSNIVLNYGEGV